MTSLYPYYTKEIFRFNFLCVTAMKSLSFHGQISRQQVFMSEQRCKRLSENISTYIPTYLWPWLQRGSRRDKNRRSRRKDEKLYKRHRRKAHTCSASNDHTNKGSFVKKKKKKLHEVYASMKMRYRSRNREFCTME